MTPRLPDAIEDDMICALDIIRCSEQEAMKNRRTDNESRQTYCLTVIAQALITLVPWLEAMPEGLDRIIEQLSEIRRSLEEKAIWHLNQQK